MGTLIAIVVAFAILTGLALAAIALGGLFSRGARCVFRD